MNTLLHAVCCLCAYIAWWHKPLDIAESYVINNDPDLAGKVCVWMVAKDNLHTTESDYNRTLAASARHKIMPKFGDQLRRNTPIGLVYADDLAIGTGVRDAPALRKTMETRIATSLERNDRAGRSDRIELFESVLQPVADLQSNIEQGYLKIYPGQKVFGFLLYIDSDMPRSGVDPFVKLPLDRLETLRLAQSL
jgi:hypothetical protein